MKHKNLQILADNGFNVPRFTVVSSPDNIDLSFSAEKLFAVRSSFGAEDGDTSSFAGQFDTFLNVERQDVPDAVKKVLQSAKNKNVSDYIKARSISADAQMSVIVQEMIDSQYSGVVFTANPMGILNETVVVVGEGTGNDVVADKIPTTAYYCNQDDGIYDCHRQEGAPLLDESILKELIDGAKKIRSVFKCETDIEYAVYNGKIYYLQARPITMLNTKSPIILDNSNIVESYSGISLPLTQSFVKRIYHKIFYNCILRISDNKALADKLDTQLKDMTDVANWRIYYRISNWYSVLKLLPFSRKIIPIWQNMLGVTNKQVSTCDDVQIGIKQKLTIFFRFVSHLYNTPRLMAELNSKFSKNYPLYQQNIIEANTPEELMQVYDRIQNSILSDWDLTLINDMYTFLCTALAGKRNRELIANVKNLESMKPTAALNSLTETARMHGISSDEYKKQAEEYISLYGDRCLSELKLETRTYRTDPQLLDSAVQKRISDLPIQINDAANNSKKTSFFVKKAKLGISNREISRLNRSRIFGLSRDIFLKIGKYYECAGEIECARDVFYLRIEEMCGDADRKALISQRKQEQLLYENTPSYSRLVFADRIINRPTHNARCDILNKPNNLNGIGTSAGKVTGEVLVIDRPDDQIDTADKILVTVSTDPGWVFLLQRAKGIISEKGSLLSHTAIISRELFKPAVVNVKDCTRLLCTGDIVELDADTGTITVKERRNGRENI